MTEIERPKGMNRRRFLDLSLGFTTAAGMLAMLATTLLYLWPGQKGPTGSKREKVCREGDLPPGSSKKLLFRGVPVIVINLNGKLKAFNAKCTHLGCVVDWDVNRLRFVCPCHAATFDSEGVPEVSITSKPLAKLKVLTSSGTVYVEGA